jgi:hypothetical protein
MQVMNLVENHVLFEKTKKKQLYSDNEDTATLSDSDNNESHHKVKHYSNSVIDSVQFSKNIS